MEYRLSVIIPCYNSESTLPETINCILGQSIYNQVQIIAVNDGSTDNTASIINEYAAKHSNIVAIHNENGGVSSARNSGIEKAEGKYMLFLDADDLISPETAENLCNKMDKFNADVSVFRITRFGFGGKEFNPVAEQISKRDIIPLYDKSLIWNYLVGNKCYRTSLIKENNLRFPKEKYSEDGAFWMSVLMKTKPVIIGVYNAISLYRRTDPAVYRSVTQTIRSDLIESFIRSMEIIENVIKESFESCELTDNEKDDYIQEFYYKVCFTLLNEFYRKFWSADDILISEIGEFYNRYYSKLNDSFKAKIISTDIGAPLFSQNEIKNSPFISIIAENPNEKFIRSLYAQSLPRFELITSSIEFRNCPFIAHSKPKALYKVKFSGKRAIDPRTVRLIYLMKKSQKTGFLPLFMIKYAAFILLKLKDYKNK